MAKRILVVGNWKMYKTAHEATAYMKVVAPLLKGVSVEAFLAVPFTALAAVAQAARGTGIGVGAQNMHDAPEGAFTGEISGPMLKEAGASFVLLGHSERRTVFGETDDFIHRKVLRALQDGLTPILCVGETLEEREEGKTKEVLQRQLRVALEGLDRGDLERLIVAYEPVWAIGTGKSATPQLAAQAHAMCRACLLPSTPILYGGSVKPENAAGFVALPEIHGVLVGGASLSAQTFSQIAIHCSKKG